MNPVTEIAESINTLVGEHGWSGGNFYLVEMVDESKRKGYLYEIRRGDNWMTLAETKADNPGLVRHFLLQKKKDEWAYLDGRLEKYGVSSLPKLLEAYGRLKIAIEASKPKQLEFKKIHLLSESNS